MNESYTETVLQAIGRTLNEGIHERTAMIIIIASVIIFIIMLTLIIGLRNRKKIRDAAETSYQKLIRKHNLTILELDLIEDLARTLHKPEDKYNLLLSKSRFRQAEKKLEGLTDKKISMLEGLKKKLGFIAPSGDSGTVTTASFSQGMPVTLFLDGHTIDAEVYSNAETNITVKYSNSPVPVSPDSELQLIASTGGRFRVFNLTPSRVKGELFSAPHAAAESVEKLSIRLDTEIEIEPSEDDKEFEELSAKIVLLSDNGIFIHDKTELIKPGDIIRLYPDNDRKKIYPAYAEVLKVSEEKQLVSARFIDNK